VRICLSLMRIYFHQRQKKDRIKRPLSLILKKGPLFFQKTWSFPKIQSFKTKKLFLDMMSIQTLQYDLTIIAEEFLSNYSFIHNPQALGPPLWTAERHSTPQYCQKPCLWPDLHKAERVQFRVKDKKPWVLVECKSNSKNLSPHLLYYSEQLKTPLNFQLTANKNYDRKHCIPNIRVMDYEKFFSGLI